MKNVFTVLVFHFCVLSFCGAQDNLVEAVIDFKKETDKHVTLLGTAKNLTDKPQDFSYTLHFTNNNSGNKSTSKQSGKFTLLPNEVKTLSTSQTNISSDSKFEATLKIYQGDKELAQHILTSDKAFFDAYQALPMTPKKKSTTSNKSTGAVQKVQPTNDKVVDSKFDAIEIGGLIIDDTRSKIGRDFYEAFYGKWRDPKDADSFSIIIKELPTPGRGRASRLSIEVDGNVVLQRIVQPRLELIEALAEQSVNMIHNHLAKRKQLNKDLGSEDQQGSGLF